MEKLRTVFLAGITLVASGSVACSEHDEKNAVSIAPIERPYQPIVPEVPPHQNLEPLVIADREILEAPIPSPTPAPIWLQPADTPPFYR